MLGFTNPRGNRDKTKHPPSTQLNSRRRRRRREGGGSARFSLRSESRARKRPLSDSSRRREMRTRAPLAREPEPTTRNRRPGTDASPENRQARRDVDVACAAVRGVELRLRGAVPANLPRVAPPLHRHGAPSATQDGPGPAQRLVEDSLLGFESGWRLSVWVKTLLSAPRRARGDARSSASQLSIRTAIRSLETYRSHRVKNRNAHRVT